MDDEDLQDWVKELDSILKGERGRGGLIGEYERHDALLTRIYAVLWQDATGQKGVLHDIDVLMGRRSQKDQSRGLKWQFWTAVTVAIISAATLLITKWPEIMKTLLPPTSLQKKIERAKHPKGKKIVRYRVVPPVSEPTKETEQKLTPPPIE